MGEIWVRPAACIVTFCLVFAYVAGIAVDYEALPPILGYAQGFAKFLTIAVGLLILWHVYALRGSPRPTQLLLGKFQANRDLAWSAAIGLSLALLQLSALTWVKPTLPMFAGFWADPLLASADAALFGTDPWRLTHAVFGPRNLLIDVIYAFWFPVVFGVLFFALIARNPIKSRLVVAYFLTVAIGILIQFALPSGGPIFYGRLGFENRFADLNPLIPEMAREGSGYLWGCHLGYRECLAGWGISAWPSMHVALATWAVVAVASLKRSLLPIALFWWAMIFIGSIYLGWHYVLDGIAGAVIVAMAWEIQNRAIPLVASELGVARR